MFFVVCLIFNHGCNTYFSLDCDSPPDPTIHCPNYFQRNCEVSIKQSCPDRIIIISIIEPIEINCYDVFQILILSFGVFFSLWLLIVHCSMHVNYVNFNINLNLYSRKNSSSVSFEYILTFLSQILLVILLNEHGIDYFLLLFFSAIPNFFDDIFFFLTKKIKFSSRITSFSLLIYISSTSFTPSTYILCLLMFQIWCYSYIRRLYYWLPIFLILISNDIELHPGHSYRNNIFKFMSWNLNSLAKNNFERLDLIEAHNNIFNYDLISLSETSLNQSVEIPETLLDGYTFVSANNPSNAIYGGVEFFL